MEDLHINKKHSNRLCWSLGGTSFFNIEWLWYLLFIRNKWRKGFLEKENTSSFFTLFVLYDIFFIHQIYLKRKDFIHYGHS